MRTGRHKWICASRAVSICSWVGVALTICNSLGCVTQTRSSLRNDSTQRSSTHDRSIRKKKILIDELQETTHAAERRRAPLVAVSSTAASGQPSTNAQLLTQAQAPTNAQQVLGAQQPRVESVGSAQTGEHFLYSKVLETYRSRNASEMQKALQLLLKTYPDSVFADNALYMAGLLAFEMNDHATALKAMENVIREHPRGNKAVAAMFTKATIEKRLRRFSDARRTLNAVRTLYPGSPEANRVVGELKLLNTSASKAREI